MFLVYLFTFSASICIKVSICCGWFLFGVCYNVMFNLLECLLIIFISIQNSRSLAKTGSLKTGALEIISTICRNQSFLRFVILQSFVFSLFCFSFSFVFVLILCFCLCFWFLFYIFLCFFVLLCFAFF